MKEELKDKIIEYYCNDLFPDIQFEYVEEFLVNSGMIGILTEGEIVELFETDGDFINIYDEGYYERYVEEYIKKPWDYFIEGNYDEETGMYKTLDGRALLDEGIGVI